MPKSFLPVVFAVTSVVSTAQAGGPPNIGGIPQRLESLTCRIAYSTTLARAEQQISPQLQAKCGSLPSLAEEMACTAAVIKSLANAVPRAVFAAKAMEGQATFDVSISVGGNSVFQSLRVGTHGDGPNGISLMFSRVGVDNETHPIETGTLTDSGKSAPLLVVPVKRRLAADLAYFFVDGCALSWAN